ncbi:MAG: hypothetical protein LBT43_20960 [Prevotella sp.]|jgi:hypothetical protein|nr:hypothetical protein [Prevotella sp.]
MPFTWVLIIILICTVAIIYLLMHGVPKPLSKVKPEDFAGGMFICVAVVCGLYIIVVLFMDSSSIQDPKEKLQNEIHALIRTRDQLLKSASQATDQNNIDSALAYAQKAKEYDDEINAKYKELWSGSTSTGESFNK